MFRSLLFLILATLAVSASADALYKWVDEQGVVHYSDKPHEGAVKLKLPPAQTYKAPVQGYVAPLPSKSSAQGYDSFIISSPGKDETLFNVTGVTVAVSLSPELRRGDTITISVDGQTKGPSNSLTATFENLERGEHAVTAVVHTASGQTITAPALSFYIRMPGGKKSL
jgi:hypothetical protein